MAKTTKTLARRGRLGELEEVIERGLTTFVEVGQALAEIRDSRLYREEHKTFEAYCRERWSLKRQRAYELMEASEAATAVSEISDIPVSRESHAAELVPLIDKPDELRKVWAEVVQDSKPSAAKVRQIVVKRQEAAALPIEEKRRQKREHERERAKVRQALTGVVPPFAAKDAPNPYVITVQREAEIHAQGIVYWAEQNGYGGLKVTVVVETSDGRQLTVKEMADKVESTEDEK